MVEHRSPKPGVVGSNPPWPAIPISERAMFKAIRKFIADVKGEFKKVTWPTREQTIKQTGVVLVITAFTSILLGVADYGLSELAKQLIG